MQNASFGLAPEKTTGAEEVLRRFKDDKILERVNYGYNGLSVRLGGLVTGGGFALGPQYFRDDLKDGALLVGAAAQFTINSFYKFDAAMRLPKLLDSKASSLLCWQTT